MEDNIFLALFWIVFGFERRFLKNNTQIKIIIPTIIPTIEPIIMDILD